MPLVSGALVSPALMRGGLSDLGRETLLAASTHCRGIPFPPTSPVRLLEPRQ